MSLGRSVFSRNRTLAIYFFSFFDGPLGKLSSFCSLVVLMRCLVVLVLVVVVVVHYCCLFLLSLS